MKKIFFAIIIAFVLNFFWEISQSFLYAPHYKGFEQLISVHLWASASDVMIVSVILLASEIIFERFLKIQKIATTSSKKIIEKIIGQV